MIELSVGEETGWRMREVGEQGTANDADEEERCAKKEK